MRLTLRTLLAYLDDILDPADQEAIRKKIDNSEFATDLLHKTRDTMRRLRLGAPAVMGGDGGLDPNTVAEYLDNTLTPEQVEDFERVCLESDIHLAEVGSCHQILTMVLGEPAEIDPEVRQRMHDLPAELDATHAVAAPVQHRVESAHPTTAEVEPPPAERTVVPDYLRESFFRRHRGKLAIAALLLILATATAWVLSFDNPPPAEVAAMGENASTLQIDEGNREDDLPGSDVYKAPGDAGETGDSEAPRFDPTISEPILPADDAPSGPVDETPLDAPVDGEPLEDVPVEDAPLVDAPLVDAPLVNEPLVDEPRLPPGLDDDPNAARSPDLQIDGEPAEPPIAPSPDDTGSDAVVGDMAPEPGVVEPPPPLVDPDHAAADDGAAATARSADATPAFPAPPGEIDPPMPATPQPPDTEGDTEGDTADAASAEAGSETPAAIPEDVVEESPAPVEPKPIAAYTASDQLLLRYNAEKASWIRLGARAPLFAGDVLLAIPASRPTIALESGLQIELGEETRVVLVEDEAARGGNGTEPAAGLDVVYGRVIASNYVKTGASTLLLVGSQRAEIRFDGTGTLAVDVRRKLPPGADPLTAAANITADFYATSGRLEYADRLSGFEVDAPATWRLTADGPTDPVPFEPSEDQRWIDGLVATGSERLAAQELSDALKPNAPIEFLLSERIDHRRRESRSFASRASVHVGQFEPFVSALNDSAQYAVWDDHIVTLRNALARSPEVAEQVRDAFDRKKGGAGNDLFKMLWEYSAENIEQESLVELIRTLDAETLDFRVLAIHNLEELTGKTLNYRPHDSQKNRQRAIRRWNERLRNSELLPAAE